MERNEIINKLTIFKTKLDSYEKLQKTIADKREKLNNYKHYNPKHLEMFDEKNMYPYIIQRLGPVPVEPKTTIFNKKKLLAEYEEKLKEYSERSEIIKKDYYKFYEKERTDALEKDKLEKQTLIERLNNEISEHENELNIISCELKKEIDIPIAYWNVKRIERLITFFVDMRVNTFQEAFNMLISEERIEEENKKNEEHRMKMEKIMEDISSRLDEVEKNVDNALREVSSLEDDIRSLRNNINDLESKID